MKDGAVIIEIIPHHLISSHHPLLQPMQNGCHFNKWKVCYTLRDLHESYTLPNFVWEEIQLQLAKYTNVKIFVLIFMKNTILYVSLFRNVNTIKIINLITLKYGHELFDKGMNNTCQTMVRHKLAPI